MFLSIPFYRNFEEINLRFYIKHNTSDGERRGVAFIKEIDPKRGIAYRTMSILRNLDCAADAAFYRTIYHSWFFEFITEHY
jgi:hypothetical protein